MKMTVYKIRDKSTGLFLNKNGNPSRRGGRVYTGIGHIKTSYKDYHLNMRDDSRYEVVQLELQEVKIIPITEIL